MAVEKISNHSDYTISFKQNDAVMGISTAGGGGHLSALRAIKSEYFKQNPLGEFRDVDVIRSSFPCYTHKLVGKMIQQWDNAKKKGDIKAQERILQAKIFGITRRRWGDLIFFIPVFLSTFFKLLFDKKVTHIVDTQPIATAAIIRAARLINWLFRRHIQVLKVMTDFPTEEAIHFAHPARLLTERDKKIFKLIATTPFKQMKGETDHDYQYRQEHWWREHFGLSMEKGEVVYRNFPIRPAFKEWQHKSKEERTNTLQVKFNNDDEYEKVSELLGGLEKQSACYGDGRKEKKDVSQIQVESDEIVGVVTIGSQASKKTKRYAEEFIQLIKKHGDPNRKYTFFIGCSYHAPGMKTLFKEVYEMMKATKDLPENLRIIPMGYQDDDELAPLFHRADFGIYGGGGQTEQEVNAVARGKVYIHSDHDVSFKEVVTEDDKVIQKELLEGLCLWEKGNAKYQINAIEASLIAPGAVFAANLYAQGALSHSCASAVA